MGTENLDVEDVDVLVVGGGKAGKTLAMDLAREGRKVAMVERAMIGGTCINVACIPTKTLINSGRVLTAVRRAAEFGVSGAGDPEMDLSSLRAHKEDVVATMVKGQLSSFTASGMDFILGEASFIGQRTVEVRADGGRTRTIRGADVVLNLGTEPLLPPIEGLEESRVHTSNTLLELHTLPRSILILGGGYIGCEFADLLNTVGVDVTLVQGGAQLLAREDADIADAITERFSEAGITVRLGSRVEKIARSDDGTATVTLASGETLTAEDALLALGRRPMTSGLNLEVAGVDLDSHGYIKVDDRLRTTAPHIWAAGDAAGSPQFTHASYDDYRVLKTELAPETGIPPRSTAGRLIPYSVFTTPELGRVGLTEQQAREAGYNVRVARMPVAAIPRARTVGHLEGLWKAVIDRDTDKILGAALLGTEASETIAVLQVAMLAGMTYQGVRDAIITHPTMAEGLTLLFTPAYLED